MNVHDCVIAVGSNLGTVHGDPAATCEASIGALARCGLEIRGISRFFRTPAWPGGSGPDYCNAAVLIRTRLAALELLTFLQRIEAQFGRQRQQRWGARTLDLDLLAIGAAIYPDLDTVQKWMRLPLNDQQTTTPEGLLIPHPRMHERAFVLAPLRDIAPGWRHPLLGETFASLAKALPHTAWQGIVPL